MHEELRVEFYAKLENGDLGDDPLLIIAAVCLEAYVQGRIKALDNDPGVGADSFKGVGD